MMREQHIVMLKAISDTILTRQLESIPVKQSIMMAVETRLKRLLGKEEKYFSLTRSRNHNK